MRTFKTLQELINYIPNCVICQKEMGLSITGHLNPVGTKVPKWSSSTERVCFRLEYKDGLLRSKQMGHSLIIEAGTNKIIDGEDVMNRMMLNAMVVKKSCRTCTFKFVCLYQDGNVKKTHHFPPIRLQIEELNYTMKGGKRLHMVKYYMLTQTQEPECAISYNNVRLQPIALDFAKLVNLEQVNNKIKTIITFQ